MRLNVKKWRLASKIWLPIYFQVSISFQILTEDADSDADRDAQMKMMPIRGSENLAGAADRQAGVFLEAERPQRDCFLTIWPVNHPVDHIPIRIVILNQYQAGGSGTWRFGADVCHQVHNK